MKNAWPQNHSFILTLELEKVGADGEEEKYPFHETASHPSVGGEFSLIEGTMGLWGFAGCVTCSSWLTF